MTVAVMRSLPSFRYKLFLLTRVTASTGSEYKRVYSIYINDEDDEDDDDDK